MELSDKARQLKNQYAREYKRKHPEKVREYMRRYWERRASQLSDPVFQVKVLHDDGYTQREIAQQLDLSLGFVNKAVNSTRT
jgi:hypothetical protein